MNSQIGIDDEGGVVEALSSSIYWTREQILSGDFGACSSGIIDVISFESIEFRTLPN